MVTREFLSNAASAWRAASCNMQQPDTYRAACGIVVQFPNSKELSNNLATPLSKQ